MFFSLVAKLRALVFELNDPAMMWYGLLKFGVGKFAGFGLYTETVCGRVTGFGCGFGIGFATGSVFFGAGFGFETVFGSGFGSTLGSSTTVSGSGTVSVPSVSAPGIGSAFGILSGCALGSVSPI